MSGALQHTIPQFFQAGFASRSGRNGPMTWIYRQGACGREDLIENVGAEYYFYAKGKEPDLDDVITELEASRYSALVRELRAEPNSTRLQDQRLSELAIHLYVRTRHVRIASVRFLESALAEVRQLLTEPSNFARAALGPSRQEEIVKSIQNRGLSRKQAKWLMRRLGPAIEAEALEQARFAAAVADAAIERAISEIKSTVKTAHVDAFQRDPTVATHAAKYASWNWYLVLCDLPLILGDSVLMYETGNAQRPFSPFTNSDETPARLWLPIANDRILVGTRSDLAPAVDPHVINSATIRCSIEYVISAVPLTRVQISSARRLRTCEKGALLLG